MNRVHRSDRPGGRRGGRRSGSRDRAEGRPAQAPSRRPSDAGAAPGTAAPEGPFVHVAFRGGRREACLNPEHLVLRCGDHVLVEAERGYDLGRVTVCEGGDLRRRRKQPVQAIVRLATPEEIERLRALAAEDRTAFETCRERAAHFSLEMKIIDAETQFDRNRITFYFTADRRVDFRELVRDLAGTFRTRIELRQVGARDAARRCDGVGPCGRSLCCTGFLFEFDPVTLKMAKEQNLPLNPAKISGSCGRLMCCLNYEASSYQDARRAAPAPGSRWILDGQLHTVGRFDVGRYRVTLEDARGERRQIGLDAFLEEAQPAPAAEEEAARVHEEETARADGEAARADEEAEQPSPGERRA